MALKFGSLFGEFTDQLKKSLSTSIDTSQIEGVSRVLDSLNQRSKELAQEIIDLDKTMAAAGEGTQEYIDAERQKARAIAEAKDIASQESSERERLNQIQQDTIGGLKRESSERVKHGRSLSQVNDDYINGVENLINSFNWATQSQADFDAQMNKLNMGKIGGMISSGLFDSMESLKGIGNIAADKLTSGLMKVLPPQFRFLAEVIKTAIIASFEQIIELNKAFIELTRNTGGLINAAKLGFNATGNLANGVMSLKTMAAQANLSVGEFAKALESLASDTFGQTIGAVQNLSKVTDDLQNYAKVAGRMQKMYQADIGASVRNLFQNYGQSIGSATKIMKDGADKALALGLNVKGFVSNFEQVTNLIGEIYFRTSEEMTKMAMVATKLGTTVDVLAGGLTKMNGLNDLFQQQQRAAALGLNEYSKSLAQIYALQKAGKGAQAAQLELATLAQSMEQYLDQNRQINQAGLDILKAQGLSTKQIEAIGKMARDPLAMKSVMSPESLTNIEREQVKRKEQENVSLEEKFNMAMTQLQGAIIDPLAKILGPFLEILSEKFLVLSEMLTEIVGGIADSVAPIWTTLQEITVQIHKALMDIWVPVKNLFQKLRQSTQPLLNMFTTIGKTLVQYLLFPLRIVGKTIGFVIDAISLVVTKVKSAFQPLFDSISNLFSAFGEGEGIFTTLLDGVSVFFGFLLDSIGTLLDLALWPLTKAIGWLVEYAINPLVEIFKTLKKNLEEAINKAPLNIFFGESETESGPTVNPAEYAKFFESQLTVPETITATSPLATASAFIPTATNTDAVMNEALMTGAFGQGQVNPNTNVVINNKVEGIFSDKQTIKKTV